MLLKSRFFKNHELYWSNLPLNSNCGREFVQKSRFKSPPGKVNFFVLFSFHFHVLHKTLNLIHKVLSSFTKNRCTEIILFYFYVIILSIDKKGCILFNIHFCTGKMKKVKKKKKEIKRQKIWPSPTEIQTPDFWTKLSRTRFEFWGRLDQ